ncbi:ShlB/FhaC/HecB family hemolysin secretion/activation protein, partial [Microcoleus sp. HI-ES]|nr:ShlB/FhaC/HecB family hemolysin secretion/activation protein [Microcoleus sp. HI-ES]
MVLLGKPAKTSASTVEILTSNVEDLAAVSSAGDTNLDSREDLATPDEKTQLPAESEHSVAAETPDLPPSVANSVDVASYTIVKNRQDGCSTRSEFDCGVGILPAGKRLIENG